MENVSSSGKDFPDLTWLLESLWPLGAELAVRKRGQMSMKTSETALCPSFNVFVVGYRPVTANQNPSKFTPTGGDVIRTIGAMHSDGRLTVPAMTELPEASARNVLVKKSFPLVELAGS